MRGNGIGTEPGIKGVHSNGSRECGGNRRCAGAMHAAQHLSKCKIERAETRRTAGGFLPTRVIKRFRLMRARVATGVPGGMHNGALLRDQQQNYTEIMKYPARHDRALPAFNAGNPPTAHYFVTVSTASVSR
jgi:hypothetical protein